MENQDKEKQQQQGQLNIELPEDVANGIYSNLAIISHSNTEFVIDFIQVLPGIPKAKVRSRLIMTPQHAKRLMMAITDNIQKYEAAFGEIEVQDPQQPNFPTNFGGPTGIA